VTDYPDVQPHELLRTFGRVANLLAANRNDSAATAACFYKLLAGTRGNRKGFPPKIKTELLVLQSANAGPHFPARTFVSVEL
jgi:hypothetical protein